MLRSLRGVRIAQPHVIAEQDEVDEPFAVEQVHRVGVDIGPPVDLFQVARNGQALNDGRAQCVTRGGCGDGEWWNHRACPFCC